MLNKKLPKLHFISQGQKPEEHLKSIEDACQAGCQWVQLRMKNTNFQEYLETALMAKEISSKYNTMLTINDNPRVALESKADGLHLGKEDISPREAREILGDIIIGGTANNWEDILRLSKEPVDYIGLGPLRFTTTKEKLSPILGVEGYKNLTQKMKSQGINLPILAIGGILTEDIPNLLDAGVWGIAVSGLIVNAEDKKAVCRAICDALEK